MPKQQNLTVVGFTQLLQAPYWRWAADDPEADALLDGRAEPLLSFLVQKLEDAGCKLSAAYGIIHDKDVYPDHLGLKPRHIHGIIRFESRKDSATLSEIASTLGIEPQYVEKPKSGRYSFDNMLSYLIHAKYLDKHQYSPMEVVTVRGEDYLHIYDRQNAAWKKGAVKIQRQNSSELLEILKAKIINEKITKEQILLTNDWFSVYAPHASEVDAVFDAVAARKAMREAQALRSGEFKTLVVYVWGASGSGKTKLVNSLVSEIQGWVSGSGSQWSLYRAATGNAMDDWDGEQIVFLDDLRGNSLESSDWLLLLDPHNASPARARYHNKAVVAPRVIFLTATVKPERYFYYTKNKGEVTEALDQFIRRVAVQIHVSDHGAGREPSYDFGVTTRLDSPRKIEFTSRGFRGDTYTDVVLHFGVAESTTCNRSQIMTLMARKVHEFSPHTFQKMSQEFREVLRAHWDNRETWAEGWGEPRAVRKQARRMREETERARRHDAAERAVARKADAAREENQKMWGVINAVECDLERERKRERERERELEELAAMWRAGRNLASNPDAPDAPDPLDEFINRK